MTRRLSARILPSDSTRLSGGRPPRLSPRLIEPREACSRMPMAPAASISSSRREPLGRREAVVWSDLFDPAVAGKQAPTGDLSPSSVHGDKHGGVADQESWHRLGGDWTDSNTRPDTRQLSDNAWLSEESHPAANPQPGETTTQLTADARKPTIPSRPPPQK